MISDIYHNQVSLLISVLPIVAEAALESTLYHARVSERMT